MRPRRRRWLTALIVALSAVPMLAPQAVEPGRASSPR